MKRSLSRTLTVLVILATCAGTALAQRRLNVLDSETIQRTLDFAPGNGKKTLEVDNVNGSIRIAGYDGRTVEMIARKSIHARSQDALNDALREVRLDIRDRADTINIFIEQPGHDRSTLTSSRNNWNSESKGYNVVFDFEIRVPRETSLHLWTVNGGDISVDGVLGDFYVSNINGGVEMRGLSGSGRAHTINGQMRAAFISNPKQDSHFGSLNGVVEVQFQRDLSADLRFKTFNGGVYTDFPVTAVSNIAGRFQRDGNRYVYKSNEFETARVGRGGPTIELDGFNGDVRILQAR